MARKYEFQECHSCAANPGQVVLCTSCVNNRQAISELSKRMETLGSAMNKFAPDLMRELVRRYSADAKVLDDFLGYMRND